MKDVIRLLLVYVSLHFKALFEASSDFSWTGDCDQRQSCTSAEDFLSYDRTPSGKMVLERQVAATAGLCFHPMWRCVAPLLAASPWAALIANMLR